MQNWKKKLLNTAIQIDDMVDKQLYRLRRRLGTMDSIQVLPFRTYGTAQHVYVRGRVLEDEKITAAREGDNLFTNLLNMYKRFETDEVPGATLQLNLPGDQQQAVTDKEGYFVFSFQPAVPLVTEELYLSIPLQLLDAGSTFTDQVVHAEMMIPRLMQNMVSSAISMIPSFAPVQPTCWPWAKRYFLVMPVPACLLPASLNFTGRCNLGVTANAITPFFM